MSAGQTLKTPISLDTIAPAHHHAVALVIHAQVANLQAVPVHVHSQDIEIPVLIAELFRVNNRFPTSPCFEVVICMQFCLSPNGRRV